MQFTIQNTGKTSVKNKYVVYCVYISDFLECNKSEHEKLLGLIRLKAIGIACVMLIVFMSSCCCYLITEITLQQNILEQISNINQNFWEVAQFTYFQHTHTHTHTRCFYGLRELSIGVMVFILYKLYVLLPYTYPPPKLSPHRILCISTFPPKKHSV